MMLLTAKWVLPITREPIDEGAVLISKDVIKAVGSKEELKKVHPKEPLIDFGRAIIMPGLVNTHTHLEYSAFRGILKNLSFFPWIVELVKKSRKLSLSDWKVSALFGTLECIKSGVTCVANIISFGPGFEVLLQSELRGLAFHEVIEIDDAKADQKILESEKIIQDWKEKCGNGLLNVGVSPHATYTVAPRVFQSLSEWAQHNGLLLSTHLAESREEYRFLKMAGLKLFWQPRGPCLPCLPEGRPTGRVSPVRYLEQLGVLDNNVIAVHCVHVDKEDIGILKEKDVGITCCPRSNARLKVGTAPLSDFFESDLRVGFGTDSLASNDDLNILSEFKTALLQHKIPPQQLVKMATLGGAQVLRMENQIGSLEEGKQADIIVVDLPIDHDDIYLSLVDAEKAKVIFTMVAGRVLYERDKCQTLDEKSISAQIQKVQSKLR
ncbi:MAG: amidohydrolase family protein [Actinomycetota bacterium]|nr:amidohydrolase family protein [Actinomycetota bacterium]